MVPQYQPFVKPEFIRHNFIHNCLQHTTTHSASTTGSRSVPPIPASESRSENPEACPAPCVSAPPLQPGPPGTPSDRTLYPGEGGDGLCRVSLGSVYVAGRVGAVCVLACVIACGLCVIPGGSQLRLALVCAMRPSLGGNGRSRSRSPRYTNVYELHAVYSQTLQACIDRLRSVASCGRLTQCGTLTLLSCHPDSRLH